MSSQHFPKHDIIFFGLFDSKLLSTLTSKALLLVFKSPLLVLLSCKIKTNPTKAAGDDRILISHEQLNTAEDSCAFPFSCEINAQTERERERLSET